MPQEIGPQAPMVSERDFSSPSRIDHVRGDATGLDIPAHAGALLADGPAFLTRAFHKFEAIDPDNSVTRITRTADCPSGSTGSKLFLSVEYERTEPGLDTELFVKFSRDFDDALRDRGKHEMESEIAFARISRLPGFPIAIPAGYFADYHHESQTGLLITETVDFGKGRIELQHHKCMDHELSNALEYYRTIVIALARVAAAHKSGALAGEVDGLLPFDAARAAQADPIPWDEAQMRDLIHRYADFAKACPQLMPEFARQPGFWARLEREAIPFLTFEKEIKRFLYADRDYIALCHWNANIDNAWFWRDDAGELHVGLMDWGRVRQLNLAFALWGSLNSAPHDLWEHHLNEILTLFVDEFRRNGGPLLDPDRLKLYLDMYVATMGLAWLMEAPMRILRYLPEASDMSGPLDPRLLECERARNQRHVSALFLTLWENHNFGRSLERLVANGFDG